MKISERDFYYGAVLAKIIDYATTTSLAKVEGVRGQYVINDDRHILIKYSAGQGREWTFKFHPNEIANARPNQTQRLFFIVLVCGVRTMCMLDSASIEALFSGNADQSNSLTVCDIRGSRLHVYNDKQGHMVETRSIARADFPSVLLDTPAPYEDNYAWPSLSTINVYDELSQRIFSSNDRGIDRSDVFPHNIPREESQIRYVGVSTQNKAWATWGKLEKTHIEERLRYLLELEAFVIDIEAIDDKAVRACSQEFVWKIEFWHADSRFVREYKQAVDLVKYYQRASGALISRHLNIGYNKAQRHLEQMERNGIVSELRSNGSREVLRAADDK
ncbi:DNA translocase FtsK [Undibacterium danionis]|uniref:DNA translocase FtsK n=1 Tax=Undibacterium danionis TaxID=1812100 RepID=A0ABV6ICM4_9BURK